MYLLQFGVYTDVWSNIPRYLLDVLTILTAGVMLSMLYCNECEILDVKNTQMYINRNFWWNFMFDLYTFKPFQT